MAKCAFCGKTIGMFTGEVKIPNTDFVYCDAHSEYRVRMRRLLEEDINADLSIVISQFHDSLRQKTDSYLEATTALVTYVVQDINRIAQEKIDAEEKAEREAIERNENEKKELLRKLENEENERRIKKLVRSMKITTGFDFQGYRIIDYCDVVFDELVVGMGMVNSIAASIDNSVSAVLGKEAVVVTNRLNQVKARLRDQVKEKAARMGANALIGIDFESSKIGDLLMISMTATAVIIELSET